LIHPKRKKSIKSDYYSLASVVDRTSFFFIFCHPKTETRQGSFLVQCHKKKLRKKVDLREKSGVDPTKLFFFTNKEFLLFLLVSLRFCLFVCLFI